MIKLKNLQKRLIKVSIIAVVGVAVSCAAAAAISSWYESANTEKANAEGQLATLRSDITMREGKAKKADEYMKLYRQIKGEGGNNIVSNLDRNTGKVWIAQAAETLGLVNLTGDFAPVAPIDNAQFRRKTLEGIMSEVKLEFTSLTDEQAIRFVEAIQKHFPGYVKVKNMQMEKMTDITSEILSSVGKGEKPELIKSSVEFLWIGVHELDDKTKAQPVQAGGAPVVQ